MPRKQGKNTSTAPLRSCPPDGSRRGTAFAAGQRQPPRSTRRHALETGTIAAIFAATLIGETFGSIFGGGGFFIQPVLLAAGIPPARAVANDVAAAAFSCASFLWSFRKGMGYAFRDRCIRISLWTAPALIAGAITGSHILSILPQDVIRWLIIGICFLGFCHTVAKIRGGEQQADDGAGEEFLPAWRWMAPAAGLGLGLYDGLSGAGGGILMLLALSAIFRMRMQMLIIITNLLSGISLGTAGITFLLLGLLDARVLAVMIPASMAGGLAAAWIVRLAREKTLRIIFALLVLSLMVYLLAGSFMPSARPPAPPG